MDGFHNIHGVVCLLRNLVAYFTSALRQQVIAFYPTNIQCFASPDQAPRPSRGPPGPWDVVNTPVIKTQRSVTAYNVLTTVHSLLSTHRTAPVNHMLQRHLLLRTCPGFPDLLVYPPGLILIRARRHRSKRVTWGGQGVLIRRRAVPAPSAPLLPHTARRRRASC